MLKRLSIVGACKAGLGGVVVNGFARHIQTESALFIVSTVLSMRGKTCVCTYYRRANTHDQNVNDRQDDLAGRRKVLTPVEVQPVHTTKTDCTS